MPKRISNRVFTVIGLCALTLLIVAIALPPFIRAHIGPAASACLDNVLLIDTAKQMWAKEHGKGPFDTPELSDLSPYFCRPGMAVIVRARASTFGYGAYARTDVETNCEPYCPADSTMTFANSYSINNMSTRPTCKVHGDLFATDLSMPNGSPSAAH